MKLYDQLRAVCADHETSLTEVLMRTGHSTGCTSSWKAGQVPRVDIVMDIAEYLHVSLDELCYGKIYRASREEFITPEQEEWLEILDQIPPDRRALCKEFLKTHIIEPERYQDKKKRIISNEYLIYRRNHHGKD